MSQVQEQQERRQFSRILFNAECTLSQEGLEWTSGVQDIAGTALVRGCNLAVAAVGPRASP